MKSSKNRNTHMQHSNIQLKDGKYFCEDVKIKQQVEIQI